MEYLFRDDQKKSKKRKKVAKATLSFALDEEGDGEESAGADSSRRSESKEQDDEASSEPAVKKSRLKKNPHVDTSFLPDRDREEAERRERERLRLEWLEKQEEIKKEDIEITYSYWDGTGHRKSVIVSLSIVYDAHLD